MLSIAYDKMEQNKEREFFSFSDTVFKSFLPYRGPLWNLMKEMQKKHKSVFSYENSTLLTIRKK